jgi:hypothetical protein
MTSQAKNGVVVPWVILAFLAGALWGALLAVSIVFTVLIPGSGWWAGIMLPPLAALLALWICAAALI